jgi:acetylornithine deacetylase/succinyl-diaminopimelate desuccinylase family protein
LKSLIRINSVNPYDGIGSGETEISEFIASTLRSYGLKPVLQPVRGRRRNVIAIVKGTGGNNLMLNGHLDTVGVSGMMVDPFEPKIKDGMMYGRGSCDTKASISGMLSAIKVVVDEGIELKGNLIFAGVIDEEYRSIGTKKLVEEYRADAAVVGEPTNMKIATAHKGYAWIEIAVTGREAHGSVPEKGIDAIEKMGMIIANLARRKKSYKGLHKLLGAPTLHMSMIRGGNEWAIVPERCILGVERRTVPGENAGIALREIRDVITKLMKEDRTIKAKTKLFFEQRPMEVKRSEQVVTSLASAYRENVERHVEYTGLPYWTDAALLVNDARIPACVFGPGDIRRAHAADEHVSVEEVTKSASVYYSAIRSYCGIHDRR